MIRYQIKQGSHQNEQIKYLKSTIEYCKQLGQRFLILSSNCIIYWKSYIDRLAKQLGGEAFNKVIEIPMELGRPNSILQIL